MSQFDPNAKPAQRHDHVGKFRIGEKRHQSLFERHLHDLDGLRFFGKLYGLEEIDQRIGEVLTLVDLTRRKDDLVRTYSRGMQQRLAIARAVIHDPDILLLDEPYTGLDQDASAMLDEVLHEIAAQGRTVVMTSHDLVRSAELASRFDVLSRGKIIASSTRKDIPKDGLLAFYRQVLEDVEKEKGRKNGKK